MDDHTPGSDRLRRLASRYEADLSHGRAEQLAARAIARARRAPTRPRRLAAAAVGTSLFVVAFTGLGFASEAAVPGDLLYPIDRAIESIGLDGGHLEERLEEAIVLADRGDRERVFQVANEVLDEVSRSGVTVKRGAPIADAVLAIDAVEVIDDAADDTQTAPESAGASSASAAAAAAVEDEGVDPIKVIRLQAENLLRTVRTATENPEAAGEMEAAAASLAEAVDAAATEGTTTTTTSTTSTTTTSSTTTSTTSTTTTTEPGSSTTSTTVPEDGGEDDGSEPGDGDGSGGGEEQPPITLPQP